jgi:hypothetical protein
MFSVFLIVVSLFSQLSFAQQSTTSTQKNTTPKLNDNVAVVAWAGYGEFEKESDLIKKLFCSSDGAFCVKPSNYVTIDSFASFPDEFTKKIKEAVDKIKYKKNPILIVSLNSHGLEGGGNW